MARYSGAVWKPLPENRTEPRITPRFVILHTIVGSAAGAYGYFLTGTNLESHFIIPKAAPTIQLIDTSRDADAQPIDYAISIETEDDGNPATDPWTAHQLSEILSICRWAHDVHGIPLRRASSPTGSGIGYHAMWGAPSPWTPYAGKTCPAAARIRQYNAMILPALASGADPPSVAQEKYDMVTPDSQLKAIAEFQRDLNFINGGRDDGGSSAYRVETDGVWGPNTQRAWREACKPDKLNIWLPSNSDPLARQYHDWMGRLVLKRRMRAEA